MVRSRGGILRNLSDDTFEIVLRRITDGQDIDLRDTAFIDPYGMVGILEAGRHISNQGLRRALFLPESENVLRYLERMDFFRYAGMFFDIVPAISDLSDKFHRSAFSDVLLEITRIERSDDIHFIVGKVKARAHAILERHLHYNERAINGFITALSEVCQNIIEHSGNTGLVGIQKYYFQKQKKNVVKIAVMDLGAGFQGTLSDRVPVSGDLDAIEKALLHGMSRYSDKGRGHGLAAVNRFIAKWNGRISIRSGTAKYSMIPDWSWGREREQKLLHFPGAQIHMMLPEVIPEYESGPGHGKVYNDE